ncbi:DUF6959 family protein [Streptomyces sp. YH02]|uniref:DUF6959 family protein n=1 Tax=Streptomyces sp. YH02 TaxID=3256999 RepID=UPI003757F655
MRCPPPDHADRPGEAGTATPSTHAEPPVGFEPTTPASQEREVGTAFAGVCQCLGVASACARSASEVSSSVVQLHPWLCPGAARCKPGTQPTARLRRWPRVPCLRRPRARFPSVVRLPSRNFPGVLIQGDTLSMLRSDVAELAELLAAGEPAAARPRRGAIGRGRSLGLRYGTAGPQHALAQEVSRVSRGCPKAALSIAPTCAGLHADAHSPTPTPHRYNHVITSPGEASDITERTTTSGFEFDD